MITRLWRGWTTPDNADAYERFLLRELLPSMREIPGFRGADVLRRSEDDEVAFVTLTRFDSLAAVHSFAGDDYETLERSDSSRATSGERFTSKRQPSPRDAPRLDAVANPRRRGTEHSALQAFSRERRLSPLAPMSSHCWWGWLDPDGGEFVDEQGAVDDVGESAAQEAQGFGFGVALSQAFGDVVASLRPGAGLREPDAVQGGVDLAVAAAVVSRNRVVLPELAGWSGSVGRRRSRQRAWRRSERRSQGCSAASGRARG